MISFDVRDYARLAYRNYVVCQIYHLLFQANKYRRCGELSACRHTMEIFVRVDI